jgi:hypothetical protein
VLDHFLSQDTTLELFGSSFKQESIRKLHLDEVGLFFAILPVTCQQCHPVLQECLFPRGVIFIRRFRKFTPCHAQSSSTAVGLLYTLIPVFGNIGHCCKVRICRSHDLPLAKDISYTPSDSRSDSPREIPHLFAYPLNLPRVVRSIHQSLDLAVRKERTSRLVIWASLSLSSLSLINQL